jgi:hypothetical protein
LKIEIGQGHSGKFVTRKLLPMLKILTARLLMPSVLLLSAISSLAQNNAKPRFNAVSVYTGIEVGSKGVKMSVLEIGKNGYNNGSFTIIKDTTVNTDFISFSPATFSATLNSFCGLYKTAGSEYGIPSKRIFTVISSGVKMQAEKDNKTSWVNNLIDSFRLKINEPERQVEVIDVLQESKLSHLGIVPESRRFNTFLIDIGSGNTKGGFFPFGDLSTFRLFQLNWGTKSTANATEKRCEGDNSLDNYYRQMYKVLSAAENSEIIYAVNSSGSYPLSDNIAMSGGIAWAVANLSHPELVDNPVVAVTYREVERLCEKLYKNIEALSPDILAQSLTTTGEREKAKKELARIHKVFDQKSLMAGAGLLLKIMRQFASAYETKQFYLVKNGAVGWISAYVNLSVGKQSF